MLASYLVPLAPEHISWLPFLGGLATTEALRPLVHPKRVSLKWPNDILIGEKKVAGVLVEHLGTRDGFDWGSLGIGINLSQKTSQLPDPVDSAVPATSVAIEGGPRVEPVALATELAGLICALVDMVDERGPRFLHSAYSSRCSTLGRDVSVLLPNSTSVEGRATVIEADGALRLQDTSGKTHKIHAGDVIHARHRTQTAPLSGGTLDRFEY